MSRSDGQGFKIGVLANTAVPAWGRVTKMFGTSNLQLTQEDNPRLLTATGKRSRPNQYYQETCCHTNSGLLQHDVC